MCGRFSLFAPQPDIETRFGAELVEDWHPWYNIAPQDDVAVITNEVTESIEQYQWGLIPHWVDDPDEWHKPINARAETVDENNSFREAFNKRRCLVLADGFYEWKGEESPKTPYRIERPDDNRSPSPGYGRPGAKTTRRCGRAHSSRQSQTRS